MAPLSARTQTADHQCEDRDTVTRIDSDLAQTTCNDSDHEGPTSDTPKSAPPTMRTKALDVLARLARETTVLSAEKTQEVIRLSMSPDVPIRRATIAVFMRVAGNTGIMSLISMLGDADAGIQGEAAAALAPFKPRQAVAPLRRLLQHEDDEVVLRAAETLGRMDDNSGLGVVTRILRSEATVNHRAAHVLGVIVGRKFRPNSEGVAAARKYAKVNKLPVAKKRRAK